MTARRRLRPSLKLTAPLLLATPVLVVTLLISLISAQQGRLAVSELTSRSLGQVHARIADQLRYLLSLPPQLVQLNHGMLSDGQLDPDDLRRWVRPLFVQSRSFGAISSISWETVDGHVAWVARYPDDKRLVFGVKDGSTAGEVVEYHYTADGSLDPEPIRSFAYDPRDWGPYQTGARQQHPTWADPVEWVDDHGQVTTIALAFVAPWHDEAGRFRGVVTAQLTMDDISRFLRSLPVSHVTLSYIVDREGRLVASSRSPRTAPRYGQAAGVADRMIAASAAALEPLYTVRENRGLGYEAQLDLEEEPYVARLTPVAGPSDLDWTVVTLTPSRALTAEIDAGHRQSLLIGGVAVALSLLLGVLLSMRLVRPMLLLIRHVRRIGAGDLDSRIHLTFSPEFAAMSDAINTMTGALKDRLRLRRSIHVAQQVQQSLLPAGVPAVPGLDVAGRSRYCDETGGDYYDFLPVAGAHPQQLTIVVGDVMGHGIGAAMLMATVRGVLHSRCEQTGDLADLLNHLNPLLADVTRGRQFMTMLLVTLDTRTGELHWASAGHGSPFLYDPEADAFVTLEGGGPPLGVLADHRYEVQRVPNLKPGQVLVAATVGVWETRNPTNDRFGRSRLLELIRQHRHDPADRLADAIDQAVEHFRAVPGREDDVTFVVAKVTDATRADGDAPHDQAAP